MRTGSKVNADLLEECTHHIHWNDHMGYEDQLEQVADLLKMLGMTVPDEELSTAQGRYTTWLRVRSARFQALRHPSRENDKELQHAEWKARALGVADEDRF